MEFFESLRKSLNLPNVFKLIPGIGPKLSELIFSTLRVKTLEELDLAADTG